MSQKRVWSLLLVSATLLLLVVPVFAQQVEVVHVRLGHPPTFWSLLLKPKFIAMFVLAAVALGLLYTGRMTEPVRLGLLGLSTLAFGIIGNLPGAFFQEFAMHPSPICAPTKPFLFGLKLPFVVMISVIGVLTLLGPKLFCSYLCPVGAVQEFAAKLSRKLGFRLFKLNPSSTLLSRILVFSLFIALSVTAYLQITYNGKVYPVSLYDSINPFHGFEFPFGQPIGRILLNFVPLVVTIALAFKWYRPFCYAVCPVGLFSHWLEQIGALRVTFVPDKCTSCNLCVTATACPAVPEVLKDGVYRPDCFACNQCVNACPVGALKWGWLRTQPQQPARGADPTSS